MNLPAQTHWHPLRLSPVFERFIGALGAKRILYTGFFSGDGEFPMERTVLLTGTLEGVLVFRASEGFVLWLQSRQNFLAAHHQSQEEILTEMVSLFCLHLFHEFWNSDNFQIGPIQPQSSHPAQWPEKKPGLSSRLTVEGQNVEILFWPNEN